MTVSDIYIRDDVSVSSAVTQDEILDILSDNDFKEHVNEFRQYLIERREQLEEGENPDVLLESLKAAAMFLLTYPGIGYSGIRVDYEGNVDIEWCLSSENFGEDSDDSAFWGDGDGAMAIKFISADAIEFALLSGPYGPKQRTERLNISGVLSHKKMNSVIEMFSNRMVAYDLE